MSFNSFIPALWEADILENLRNAHVYAQCFNKNYEGEIKGMGSSLRINSVGPITAKTYTRNSDIDAPETLDMAGQTLVITEADYYHFSIDDVDRVQARADVRSDAMREAAYSIADKADTFLANALKDGAANTLTAATVGTGAGEVALYDVLVEMQVALDESNTPSNDRWVVLPPWSRGMLTLDSRFTNFGTAESNARLRGRPISEGAGFNIYVSNKVPRDGSEFVILAGYTGAATYAEQIMETAAYKPERRFGDAMKALHVYGAQVTRPSNLVRFDATKGTFRA